MKVYALYLPQFHAIPENDEWWGEGFTEWDNVKNARPLFKGHLQPKHPANEYYYNLLEKETVVWQTNLLKDYHIDGLVYYHYYFNGKKLLEKPAENLLQWKDINQNFFFNWANHSWNRAWNGSRELLIEQTYGDITDWRKHFDYLLPFFRDSRYVKINGCPVLMIYNPSFPEKEEMMTCFDTWCKNEGFEGLFLIEECLSLPDPIYFDHIIEHLTSPTKRVYLTQPSICRQWYINSSNLFYKVGIKVLNRLNQKGLVKRPLVYNGDKMLKAMIKKEPLGNSVVHGVFFEWDNTPRHKRRGYIITPIKKNTLFEYLDRIKDDDFLVINAWNEWAEGMMIEPTEEWGNRYLEWIKEWKEKSSEGV